MLNSKKIILLLFSVFSFQQNKLYPNAHLFLCQKTPQTSIFKRERAEKALLLKISLTRKRWSKNVFKCMMPKPKAYSSKKYKI